MNKQQNMQINFERPYHRYTSVAILITDPVSLTVVEIHFRSPTCLIILIFPLQKGGVVREI